MRKNVDKADRSHYAIEVKELCKRFGETVAVDGLSLHVEAGEIVGLIGPDGAGKTTTMRVLCGLVRPESGSAQVAGFDSLLQSRGVKENVGYMPQRFSLYPDLSVAENLGFFADLFGVAGKERQRLEQRVMEFSRLGPFRSRRAGQLSGGMKQKLALSCTLIHTPKVLVLDEPTTGVDPVSRREFWRILHELAAEGLALLVSTPYMDEAEQCDRVILMHRGRAITGGRAEDIPRLFSRRIVSVKGRALTEARERLLTDLRVNVHRFGDSLHVTYEASLSLQRIREVLTQVDVQVEPVEATVEDTFIDLIEGEMS